MTTDAGATLPTIAALDDAASALETLRTLVVQISTKVADPALKSEQDYMRVVVPQLDEATATYQALAAFLREHKRHGDKESNASASPGASFRDVQRAFVRIMQELQRAQHEATALRETLCDADFLKGSGGTQISSQDIQTAKEEVLEAGELAQEAAAVNALFREVGAIVSEQGKGVEQIEAKVEAVRLEIGKGVNELEHARQLQREARQKYLYALAFTLLVAAAVVLPIVFSVV